MSKVQLIKPHTHAGMHYEPGEVIDVSAPDAAWLHDLGIVRPHHPASDDVTHSTKRGRGRDPDSDTEENPQ